MPEEEAKKRQGENRKGRGRESASTYDELVSVEVILRDLEIRWCRSLSHPAGWKDVVVHCICHCGLQL